MYKTLILLIIVCISCNITPAPIDYGFDDCDYCKMIIVNPQYGSEIVTSKGKVYKFDAIECMLNYLEENEKSKMALLLMNTFDKPGELTNAVDGSFLISKELPSPMGAFITGFESEKIADEMQKSKGGNLYSWSELVTHMKTN